MQATLIRALLRLLALLPLRAAHAVGAGLGHLAWLLAADARRATLTNLALCMPELSPAERRRLARRSLVETGKTVAEMGALWFWSAERVRRLMREVRGAETLRAALSHGKGVICLTPHLGAWELTSQFCVEHGPITCLYRPPRMEELGDMVRTARERMGARLVPTTPGGIKTLYGALDRGESVGILPDQDAGAGGVFAPFFGQPASTMTLVQRLVRRSGATVVLLYAERLPKGRGYRIHLEPAPEGIGDPDPQAAIAALNHGIEQCVRALPEQYQWSYKRFKTRPPGVPPHY